MELNFFSFAIGIICIIHHGDAQQDCEVPKVSKPYIDNIFTRYGSEGILNATGLMNLLKSLKLDKVNTICEEGDTECQKMELHLVGVKRDVLAINSRKRREVSSRNNDKHKRTMNYTTQRCEAVNNTLKNTFNIEPTANTIAQRDFLKFCPFILDNVDKKACEHYHKRFPEFKFPEPEPSDAEKWGYGVLAITICSALSLTVIIMIPCLEQSYYDKVMAFLVALAVGTLCGDALLHLIPHAFIEGANNAAGLQVSEEQEEKQHKSQVYRAMIVMAGVYMFFVVEQLMKLKGSMAKKHDHGHNNHEKEELKAVTESGDERGENQFDGVVVDNAHSHGPNAGHGHSHGEKNITGSTGISTVAWMVVVGDGFHNFSDGLATGAAFSASIISGVSTTIAIFCHELPHELGDFAVLLKAGMTVKQAIVYNLVGAVLSYVGLAIGILAGTNELGRHVILCLTAGLFLYISLVNMMTEVAGSEPDIHKWGTIICQHLGMLTGIAIMLVISLYE